MSFDKLSEDMIKIGLGFAKEKYFSYLKKRKMKSIPTDDIERVVDKVYTDGLKQELCTFIRTELKRKYKEQYSPFFVEQCLNELSDMAESKRIICAEIFKFQFS